MLFMPIDADFDEIPGLIIQTNFRSGSSFVGQLFNQHPQVFYSYEPLVISPSNTTLQEYLLRSAISCQLPAASSFFESSEKPRSAVLQNCIKHDVCFRFVAYVLHFPSYFHKDPALPGQAFPSALNARS